MTAGRLEKKEFRYEYHDVVRAHRHIGVCQPRSGNWGGCFSANHARRQLVPFGTVSLTTYFHADAADLAAEDTTRVLGIADAKIFHKSYGDQNGELWAPGGRLLATTTQIAYFKA